MGHGSGRLRVDRVVLGSRYSGCDVLHTATQQSRGRQDISGEGRDTVALRIANLPDVGRPYREHAIAVSTSRSVYLGPRGQSAWVEFAAWGRGWLRRFPSRCGAARVQYLRSLPPAFIGVGALDLFVEENITYASPLLSAGVPTELCAMLGTFHAPEAFSQKQKSLGSSMKSGTARWRVAFETPATSRALAERSETSRQDRPAAQTGTFVFLEELRGSGQSERDVRLA